MEEKDIHFGKIFGFVVYITTVVFIYIFMVTLVPIPEKNVRFVDTSFGFLLGTVLAGGIAYLLGGSPDKKKEAPTNDNSTKIDKITTDTIQLTDNNNQ